MDKYFGGFRDYDNMKNQFSVTRYGRGHKTSEKIVPEEFPSDEEVLFASYENYGYEGSAIVLFRRDGKFFVDESSHCSCYGLEDCWAPQHIAPEQIIRLAEVVGNHHDKAALPLITAIAIIENKVQ